MEAPLAYTRFEKLILGPLVDVPVDFRSRMLSTIVPPPLSLALTWFVAQGIATKPFDRALEFNLQALTQFVVATDKKVSFNLTPQARDLLRRLHENLGAVTGQSST